MAVQPADAVDRWLTETEIGGADDSYDGSLETLTGQDTVTVAVGAQGNGGAFAFAPVAARVSVGTELEFEWTGEGVRYTRTLDTAGVLLAHCEPRLSLGMKLGLVVE